MLSTTSQYALRALSCLARASEGQALLGRELSILANVPASYLAKILLDLKRLGIVDATRGSNGGYRLVRPASEVHLAEIVETFEGSLNTAACILGDGRVCSDHDPCPAHSRFHSVRRAFHEFLQNTTLAEIATHPEALAGGFVEVSPGGRACAR
jgi:Rrf2 family transcriptional regulator, iron-sulfur cluster assembly transcription factor